jgi:hypothetical protein
MARVDLLGPDERASLSEDDSPFLSIADFFSLVSLTVIYLVITFSPQTPATESAIEAVTGTASGTGPASAVNTKLAYVAVLGGGGLVVRVILPGSDAAEDKQFDASEKGGAEAQAWVLSKLGSQPDIERVMLYMNSGESRGELHKAFNELTHEVHKHFKVSIVYLDSPEPSP